MLDTHVFIWWIAGPARLERPVLEAVSSEDNRVMVSAVTPWEIAIKRAIGRIQFPLETFDEIIVRAGFEVLPILPAHGIAAGALARLHNDPFDRLLIGQAVADGLTLGTRNRAIMQYDVRVFPVADR